MRIIEQLVYKITGDNSEFDKSIDKSETKVSKFGSVADKMFAGVTVAAIGMVVKKMGDMVISSANALDRVDKLSQKIGLSRVAFQEWDYILGQSGASVEGLQMGIKTLSNAADEAKKGTALYAESFDKLGVSVTDTNGKMKDQETLFAEVFSALADMENQTERTAIANKLLGRSATELAPALNTSKKEIEQLRKEAHDLGVVYSDEVVDAGVLLGDNIERLTKAFGGLKTKALAPIIGLAVTFTDKLLGQNIATTDLNDITGSIVATSLEYKDVVNKLATDIDTMTESEKLNLIARKASLEFDTIKQLEEMSKEYDAVSARLVSNSKEIEANNKKINDADISIEQYAKQLGMTSDQLKASSQDYTEWNNKSQTSIRIFQDVNRLLGDKIYYEGLNSKAAEDSAKAEGERQAFINKTALLIQTEQISMESLLGINAELTQAIKNKVDAIKEEKQAIEARNKAIELAGEAFKAYGDASQETLERLINLNSANKDSAYSTELVRLATEKLNEILAEKAKLAETEAEKEEARAEIIANTTKAISDAEKVSIALGDAYDLTSAKAGIFTSAIETLIESGLEPSDNRIQTLIASLQELSTTTEEVTFERLSLLATEEEAFLFSLKKQSEAYLEQGYELAEIDAWKEKKKEEFYANIEKLQEAQTEKAIEEAKRARDAWVDASFGMLSSITSIWGSINQVQENQNQSELQRIKEQNEATLESARLRGASEEELTELEKSLQADLNDTKNQYAKEESERKKAQATFSAIIDTASAIIGFLANPGGWAGWALSAGAVGIGAAQLAAINSAPVPSYDVGSIRIPETTQAVVHKDEMILTAPQAEQARREGITIAPTNSTSGRIPIQNVIYLDGKQISEAVVQYLNSGSVGTIKTRVVK